MVEDGVGLKWSAREGEDVIAWNVYRKDPPETEFRLVGSSRGTSYHDTGLEPDRLYVYALTALDSGVPRDRPSRGSSPSRSPAPQAPAEPQRPAAAWRVRRTRLVALVAGGGDLPFERPADVAVGPVSGSVYVADSGRNLVFVFSAAGGLPAHHRGGPGRAERLQERCSAWRSTGTRTSTSSTPAPARSRSSRRRGAPAAASTCPGAAGAAPPA